MSKNGNLKREDINEEIKLLPDTEQYFISPTGKVYKKTSNNLYLQIKLNQHPTGYVYTAYTTKDGKRVTRRVHRLVAQVCISNSNNYNIVGHKNNIKNDNRMENLYWTTVAENTQKAFMDKLIINDSGYQDSQSHPIIVYDSSMKEIDRLGSFREGAKKYGISISTIARHCKGEIKGRSRCGYYFRYDPNFK